MLKLKNVLKLLFQVANMDNPIRLVCGMPRCGTLITNETFRNPNGIRMCVGCTGYVVPPPNTPGKDTG